MGVCSALARGSLRSFCPWEFAEVYNSRSNTKYLPMAKMEANTKGLLTKTFNIFYFQCGGKEIAAAGGIFPALLHLHFWEPIFCTSALLESALLSGARENFFCTLSASAENISARLHFCQVQKMQKCRFSVFSPSVFSGPAGWLE